MSSTYQRPVVFDEYMSMFILMGAMPNNTSGGGSGGVSPSPLLYTEVARMRYTSRGKVRNTLAPRGNLLVKVPKDNQSMVSSKQSRNLHTPDFQNIGSMKTTAQCYKMPLRCWRNHVGRYRFFDQELFRSLSVRVVLIYIYIYISSTERSSQSTIVLVCVFSDPGLLRNIRNSCRFLKMVWITKRAAAMIALSFL